MPIRHATPRVYPLSLRPGRGGAQTLPTSVFSSLMRGVPESFWPPASVGASMRPDLYCCLSSIDVRSAAFASARVRPPTPMSPSRVEKRAVSYTHLTLPTKA